MAKNIAKIYIDEYPKDMNSTRYVRKIFKEYNENLVVNRFRFEKGEYGKPYIVGSKIKFNVSHTKDIIICALSPYEIGCDVERYRDVDDKISERCFTKEEHEMLCSIDDEQKRKEYFIKLWTYKESFIKCIGEGLHRPLNSFNFSSFIKELPKVVKVKNITEDSIILSDSDLCKIYEEEGIKYQFFDIDINEYKISICITKGGRI